MLFFLVLLLQMPLISGSNDEVRVPLSFKQIPGTSTAEITKIGSTLTCNEQRSTMRDCVQECYSRNSTDTGCSGFYTDSTLDGDCYLCHVSNLNEVDGGMFSTFEASNLIYILRHRPPEPEVALSFDTHSGTTIPGTGTEGTTSNVVEGDYVSGISGTALYIHDEGKSGFDRIQH